MQRKIVNRLVVIPMISLVALCTIAVLLVSLIAYRDKVHSAVYEKIDYGYISVEYAISDIMSTQMHCIAEIPETEDFIESLISGDSERLYAVMRPKLIAEDMDYGLITDAEGNVLLRIHDIDNNGDNAAGKPQINDALNGITGASLSGNDNEPLRITACAPIFDTNHEIIGTITVGRTLTTRSLTNRIKNQTGCEITFFDGPSAVASSTLPFPSLSYIDDKYREDIIKEVFINGNIFQGILYFREDSILSMIYPLFGDEDKAVGMIFIGVPVTAANSELIAFLLKCSVAMLVVLAVAIFVIILIARLIIGRLDKMEQHMVNRDKLFEAVNHASVILLQIDETDDIRVPLISCMQLIGSALGVDHVHLWRGQSGDNDGHQFVREYSWVSDYGKRKARTPKYLNSTSDRADLDWMDKFLKNEHISGIIADMEESNQELLRALEVKSIAMIPLFLEDQFWGMFSIDNIQEAKMYSDDEVDILRSISLMMASIVRRHDLQNENLKVYFDALTGINNRRYFDKTMARTISSLSRSGSELGLMMIDVDFFKKYNDTYGHGAGDECLIRVAEILSQSASRVDDFVARYGGEEFVVVMPSTDKDGAIAVAKRIIDNIREAAIPHKASDVAEHVTVSIGVTSGKVTQHHTTEFFVNRADDLLYKSKNSGRNKYTYGVLK